MSWIHVVDYAKATGKFKEVYQQVKGKLGKVSYGMREHCLNPRAMQDEIIGTYVPILVIDFG